MTLLEVRELAVDAGGIPIVCRLSFSIEPGERVGLIGESGSGKTMVALAIMGLLGEGLGQSGSVVFEGTELTNLSDRRYSELRGNRLAMVFQEPMTALDPLMRVGKQVTDAIRLHRRVGRGEARQRMHSLLARVGFSNPKEQARRFPHQLSGGQRQRVVIAIALACDPALVLADEPTTALDVTVQAQVLDLLQTLVAEESSALLLISHDLAVVSSVCDRILVMYGGTLVESCTTAELLAAPRHPYTVALLQTSRGVGGEAPAGQLPTIPGSVPALGGFPSGCVFRGRCSREQARCQEVPALVGGEHQVACWYPVESSGPVPAPRSGPQPS
ncbi:MAG: ABC transporter ATP-binding protein [Candidatus Dormibacteria bacterium]